MLKNDECYLKRRNFELKEVLGKKEHENIYLIYDSKTGKDFVLKSMAPYKFNQQAADLMIDTEDFNVVRLYEYEMLFGRMYLVFEYCENSIAQFIRENCGTNKDELIRYSRLILKAVKNFHENKIAHKNLKPNNILIDKYERVRFTDFGYCCASEFDTFEDEFNKNVPFLPPEFLNISKLDPYKADVWAIGVIFFMMATGKTPWEAEIETEVKYKILKENPMYNLIEDEDYAAVIKACLQTDPDLRPLIIELLEFPIFKQASNTFIMRRPRNMARMGSFRLTTRSSMIVQPKPTKVKPHPVC